MEIASISWSRYLLIFIDYVSKHVWIYFLKRKSEVLYMIFRSFVENQLGHAIEIHRADKGKKHVNNQFEAFCQRRGIVCQCAIPHFQTKWYYCTLKWLWWRWHSTWCTTKIWNKVLGKASCMCLLYPHMLFHSNVKGVIPEEAWEKFHSSTLHDIWLWCLGTHF